MIASWQESYDKLDRVLKSRDITLPTKVHIVKALVFPAVIHKLPKGKWQDENGKVYKGGKTYTIDVPLDRLPRFTRK